MQINCVANFVVAIVTKVLLAVACIAGVMAAPVEQQEVDTEITTDLNTAEGHHGAYGGYGVHGYGGHGYGQGAGYGGRPTGPNH